MGCHPTWQIASRVTQVLEAFSELLQVCLLLGNISYSSLAFWSLGVLTTRCHHLTKDLQPHAEAAHSRHPGVRQARSAKLVACRGFQSSKAAVAPQRTLIAPEALYGRIEDNLQCSIFTRPPPKVRQHTQRHHSQPERIAHQVV